MTKQPAFMNWHENKPSLNLDEVYFRIKTSVEYPSVDTYGPYFKKGLFNYRTYIRNHLQNSIEYINEIRIADPEPENDEYEVNLAYIRILQACKDWNDVRREFPEGLKIDVGGSEFDFWVYVGITIDWEKERFSVYNKWDYDDGPYIDDIVIQKITEKMIKE